MRSVIAKAFERNWARPNSKVLSSLALASSPSRTRHGGSGAGGDSNHVLMGDPPPASLSLNGTGGDTYTPNNNNNNNNSSSTAAANLSLPSDSSGRAATVGNDPSSSSSSSVDGKLMRLRGARMAVVYERMMVDRSALWNLVAAAVADMLRCLAMPAAMPFDDFLAVLWAVSTIVNLGREFCGAESKSLLDALHMKVREYLQNTHAESFQVLRQMVESEAWRCVPIALEEMGGVLGVIKKTLPPLPKPPPQQQPHATSSNNNNSNHHRNGGITATAETSVIASDDQGQSQGMSDTTKSSSSSSSSSSSGSSSSTSILMSFAVCGNPLRLHNDDDDHACAANGEGSGKGKGSDEDLRLINTRQHPLLVPRTLLIWTPLHPLLIHPLLIHPFGLLLSPF